MDWQGWFALGLAGVALILMSAGRYAPHLVMVAVLIILNASGIISAEQALMGFSNAGLITVVALFVVATMIPAILVIPVVLSMTRTMGVEAEPFVIAVMMAASASFATPIGYQTNMMVFGPGGYRFADFLRVGLPMNVLIGLASVVVIAVVYGIGPGL